MADTSKPHDSHAADSGKLWGGRFTESMDPLMVSYNESIHFDRAFYVQDIKGSIAFARANVGTGILTQDEFLTIEKGLKQIMEEWKTNQFVIKSGIDEDIHTANERRLSELIGKDIAGKLHTGRSRNDQVATDLRLWLRDELVLVQTLLIGFLKTITERAEQDIDYIFPGYTHLQRAQPVRWSHWLMNYGSYFATDLEKLREVTRRVNKSPLGCGALSGNVFGIDREAMAQELGFDGLIHNSMAAVGDRDFILETLQWASMLMLHISRWSEDLIIYGTSEFGYIKLADAYSTGSSLMPQKKNSDSLELLRGKVGRVFGQAAGLFVSIKGLPSTYNKDLQESTEPMLEHLKTVKDSLTIATRVLATLSVNPEKMLAAVTPDMLATDLAEYLVRKNVPFREAHHIAGRVVALAETSGTPMDKLSPAQLSQVDARFEADASEIFNPERSVELKSAIGGTSRTAVRDQIRVLHGIMSAADPHDAKLTLTPHGLQLLEAKMAVDRSAEATYKLL